MYFTNGQVLCFLEENQRTSYKHTDISPHLTSPEGEGQIPLAVNLSSDNQSAIGYKSVIGYKSAIGFHKQE